MPDTLEKLQTLSRDSQYDLACACASSPAEHRRRGADDRWVYPVTVPGGGTSFLFKTLLSNECLNNCRYCPLRVTRDPQRCSLEPSELVRAFLEYYRRGSVQGLFLSSGVRGSPDATMGRINASARLLRRSGFRGYIHLKIIPGASDNAITDALSLASTVSLNIETAGERYFSRLCTSKRYAEDILRPIRLISRLTGRGARYHGVKQTTQFVVGAAGERDADIVSYCGTLYREMKIARVYFSAYQRGLGDAVLPGEQSGQSNMQLLAREHRLYQVDWLTRKYGFGHDEIPFDSDGNLALSLDPKQHWAQLHPEYFPVNVNNAARSQLLRVPGFGEVTVDRILCLRRSGRRINRLEDLGRVGKRLAAARQYVSF